MTKPKAIILTGYGINCDYETEFAFKKAGAEVESIHINDLISGQKKIKDYQIFVFPGGFSYGDYVASGRILANKVKHKLGDVLYQFIADGKLVCGFCNGFQVMTKMGLLGTDPEYRTQTATLAHNTTGRYEDRWTWLKSTTDKCVYTKDIDMIYLPVAHGEGKFVAPKEVIDKLEENKQVVFKYAKQNGELANGEFPFSPNGSMNDIVGICDLTGRVFGMMPHPERFLHITNKPGWTLEKEIAKRERKEFKEEGEGIKIFQNAVNYFR